MTDNPSNELGARIRAARLAHGLTQDQLARAVGVTRSAVAQWETGRAGQVGGNLSRIAKVLSTDPTFLLSGGANSDAASPALRGDELAILRAYRDCSPEDRALLLRTALRLVRRRDASDQP